MTLPLLAGLVTALLVVGAVASFRRHPPRTVCPDCGGETAAVALPPAARVAERWVSRRWCPRCGWSGVGRKGPVYIPGTPPRAHDSGFHWGEEILPPDFGFRWGESEGAPFPTDSLGPPPDGGFRWSRRGEAADPPPVHPSGFRWGRLDEDGSRTAGSGGAAGGGRRGAGGESPEAAHPSGFRWSEEGTGGRGPGDAGSPPTGHRHLLRVREARRAGFRWRRRRPHGDPRPRRGGEDESLPG